MPDFMQKYGTLTVQQALNLNSSHKGSEAQEVAKRTEVGPSKIRCEVTGCTNPAVLKVRLHDKQGNQRSGFRRVCPKHYILGVHRMRDMLGIKRPEE